jgi:unsaturated rhamnogalacturonyl hydrolase
MKRALCGLWFSVAVSMAAVVAVDGYHNNETKDAEHYRWEGTRNGGYSQLGAVIQGLGGELRTVRELIAAKTLRGVDVLIIADPDTPAEAAGPKYIAAGEIVAVEQWVSAGGRLVLLGNDKGNAEFERFNQLAARFGIEFVETIYRDADGKSKLNLTSQSPVLGAGLTAYLVDVAPLKVSSKKSETLLSDGNTPIMALVRHGAGLVVALGDPWIYNEYINSKDNHRMAENLFRFLLKR